MSTEVYMKCSKERNASKATRNTGLPSFSLTPLTVNTTNNNSTLVDSLCVIFYGLVLFKKDGEVVSRFEFTGEWMLKFGFWDHFFDEFPSSLGGAKRLHVVDMDFSL
ncbi:hypothetical protein NC651_029123 [Populus alba x Populus x berolinensis]|nr:hypothetical protein NC651_029117 [Populus alba x Populus x berolinensis]KAJ6882741.1 hypothetical protein NC651_029123 [Populus alba x Populus x berolinensis]